MMKQMTAKKGNANCCWFPIATLGANIEREASKRTVNVCV